RQAAPWGGGGARGGTRYVLWSTRAGRVAMLVTSTRTSTLERREFKQPKRAHADGQLLLVLLFACQLTPSSTASQSSRRDILVKPFPSCCYRICSQTAMSQKTIPPHTSPN